VTTTAAGTGWYVYGVVDAELPLDAALVGLRLVPQEELAAVVAPVDLREFGEAPLAERLNDREWLEEKARAHEDVLERVAAAGIVVPFRFGAIYKRLDDIRELLSARRDELRAALERVRGRVELGVKGWADRTRLEETLGRAPETTRAGSGRAYLERRQVEREAAADASAAAMVAARAAHDRLLRCAVEGVVNRPQSRELSGRSEQMLLNAAYLVESDDRSLAAEVDALNETYGRFGISFELTGPWPPYNFVDQEDSPS